MHGKEQAGMAGARVYTHAERMRVVTGILTCILLAALDQTVVLPAIPQMAASLHGAAHISWVVSAFLLTATATTPIYGKLSDQLGRRAVLMPALCGFAAATILCALASSVPMLIAARALQGLGGGALMSVSQSAVGDVIPPRERGKYQAWFAGTWAISSVAGPILGGFLTQHFSWRWIFWLNLPLVALAMALVWRGLAGLQPAGLRRGIDYLGAGLLMAGVGIVLLGMSVGGVDLAWDSPALLGIFLAGILLIALLVWQQRRAPAPLFPGALLGKAAFRGVLEISFLNAAAMFGAIFMFPLLMQWLYRQSPAASGLDIVPFLFTSTVGAFGAGQITRRTGRTRSLMAAGVGLAAIGFLILAAAPGQGGLIYPVLVSAVFGLGIGSVMPTSLVAAQSQSGRADMGASTGALLLLRAMGGAFGATLAGAFLAVAHTHLAEGFRLGFLACAGLQLIACFVAMRMEDLELRAAVEAKA